MAIGLSIGVQLMVRAEVSPALILQNHALFHVHALTHAGMRMRRGREGGRKEGRKEESELDREREKIGGAVLFVLAVASFGT
jgi:hypothetical protein